MMKGSRNKFKNIKKSRYKQKTKRSKTKGERKIFCICMRTIKNMKRKGKECRKRIKE